MKNAYLVISVADIKAMLAVAELEQKRRNRYSDAVTIVLEGIEATDINEDEPQICSWSVNQAVRKAGQDSVTMTEEEFGAFQAQRNVSDMAQSVRESLGMD